MKIGRGGGAPPCVATRNFAESIESGQCPKRELVFCVGALCLLLRAVAPMEGFAKNSKVVVLEIGRGFIACQSTTSQKIIPIFREYFTLKSKSGLEVTRKQYPLRLAYAITSRKCQGVTLDRCALDFSTNCFARGQLYVMLSRVRGKKNLLIYNPRYECDGDVFAENIAWRGALRKFGIDSAAVDPGIGSARERKLYLSSIIRKSGGARHADLDGAQFE